LALLYLLRPGRKRWRLERGLRERLGYLGGKCQSTGDHPVWFHASSVGEVQITVPLIRAVQTRFPDHRVVLSTTTETGQDVAGRLLQDPKGVFFSPLDLPWVVRKVLNTVSPRALFIAETEIWPILLDHCRRRGVPVVLFNGRISDRSFESYRRFRFFFREVLGGVVAFGMQSQEDAERIVEIGASGHRVFVTGNLKFDRPVVYPVEAETNKIRASLGLGETQPVFVAGSTHRGEEEAVLEVFRRLKGVEPAIVLILAPRHLERIDEITRSLERDGFVWVRKSQMRGEGSPGEVILLDTIGELERLYTIGTVVFVGGSLVPVGGHNILEPVAFGKPVLFGPHMENFRDIVRIVKAEEGGVEVRDRQALFEQAQRLLVDRPYYHRVSRAARRTVQNNQGAIQKTIDLLERYLE
jgi:3-deoxy-D-manno-octulosonic-acid transferase